MTSGSLLSWAQQSTCVLCGEGAQQMETLNCFLRKKPAHKLCIGLKETIKGNILCSCDNCISLSLADFVFELLELKLNIAKLEKIPEKDGHIVRSSKPIQTERNRKICQRI